MLIFIQAVDWDLSTELIHAIHNKQITQSLHKKLFPIQQLELIKSLKIEKQFQLITKNEVRGLIHKSSNIELVKDFQQERNEQMTKLVSSFQNLCTGMPSCNE